MANQVTVIFTKGVHIKTLCRRCNQLPLVTIPGVTSCLQILSPVQLAACRSYPRCNQPLVDPVPHVTRGSEHCENRSQFVKTDHEAHRNLKHLIKSIRIQRIAGARGFPLTMLILHFVRDVLHKSPDHKILEKGREKKSFPVTISLRDFAVQGG